MNLLEFAAAHSGENDSQHSQHEAPEKEAEAAEKSSDGAGQGKSP
jgi:hypothetical protein